MFPARVALHWVLPANVSVSGITGTVWAGRANEASAEGLYFSDIEWQIEPLQILTGALVYDVQVKPVSGFIESELRVGFGGSITLRDLSASVPLASFAGALMIPGLQGSTSIQFKRLTLDGDLPTAANGRVSIADLVLPLVSASPLGGYQLEFLTQEDGIVASIEDSDGLIDIAGSLSLKNDRTYQILAQVIAKPESPAALRRQIDFLPQINDRGHRELRLEGQL
jgi:general secretion pathway protein N